MLLPITCLARGIVVNVAGDVMLGGRWEQQVSRNSYFYPFEQIAPEFARADITWVNLEAPLTSRGKEFVDKKFRFRVRPEAVTGLKRAGISVVTLANNHIMDFGSQGLSDTLQLLQMAGIDHVGAGADLSQARKPVIYNLRGIRVALLGYSLTLPSEFWATDKQAGTAPLFEQYAREDIAAARRQADLVLVAVHWGGEGITELREYQPRLGKMMIDAGADAVLGHHPHILQGVERYKQGIIFYSLGNFAFASKSRLADRTLLVRLHFDGNRRTAELVPVNIRHSEVGFQPAVLTGPEAALLMGRLEQLPPAQIKIKQQEGHYLLDF